MTTKTLMRFDDPAASVAILMDCDDARNGVIVAVWRDGDIVEERIFDRGNADTNLGKATIYADQLSKRYGVEWQSN